MVSIDNQVAQLVIEYHRYSSVYFSVNGYIYVYTIYILICKVSFIPSLEFVAIPPPFPGFKSSCCLGPIEGASICPQWLDAATRGCSIGTLVAEMAWNVYSKQT